MKIEEIREAALAGKTFTFNDVKIHEFDMSEGIFNIIYSLPSIEYKPYCAGLDVKEISVYEPPKYDPCRLFKKGDEVEYHPKDGRANPNLLVGRKYKVAADEPCDSGIVQVEFDGLRHLDTFVAYNNLELVTPVEELEPYTVREYEESFAVEKSGNIYSVFFKGSYYAKAKEAAETERDRLNAEYRKEQNND